jgi:CheY-like chemotaxis protein
VLPESPQNLNGLRILIVEDDPMLAFVFKTFLEECGGEVIGPANSLQAAFALLEKRNFDCAVMDVRLNRETVFALAAQIQEIGIPFAFVTGNSIKTLPVEFRDKPILLKPVDFRQLLSVIAGLNTPVCQTASAELPAAHPL